MTRDMELIREILRHVKSRQDANPRPVKIPGYADDVVWRHVEMPVQAGLLQCSPPLRPRYPILVTDMSWEGHDFVAALENETVVWAKIKNSFSAEELITLPFSVMKTIEVDLLTQVAKQQAGL